MQRNNEAQEQPMPVKVLYMKPQVSKRTTSRKDDIDNSIEKAKHFLDLNTFPARSGGKPPRPQRSKEDRDVRLELTGPADRDLLGGHNLFDVSGIFKKKKCITATDRRVASQRAYSESIRKRNKSKLKKPQKFEEIVSPTAQIEVSTAAEDPKLRLPHSKNRFQGEFSNLDLFRKAKEKLLQEKLEKAEQEALAAQKKANDVAFMAALQERNRELVRPSRSHGTLKRREQEHKEAIRHFEMQLQREHKRELRRKRQSEGRGVALGLDQASRSKLRRL